MSTAVTPRNMIQVAGVRDAAEAKALVDCGVEWLGFPFGLDHHAEDLALTDAARIVRELPSGVRGVLITYQATCEGVIELAEALGVTAVQLHGRVGAELARELRRARPGWFLIRSLVLGRPAEPLPYDEARAFAPHVDAFLTDTYDPATGASGATGKTHDWSVSRRLVEAGLRPVILAGGLTPENVADAIDQVKPWGVDAHTGLERADGGKCPRKVERFIAEARRAWASLHARQAGR